MGYFFYLDSLFSPHGDHFFRVCVCGGGGGFCMGEGGIIGLAPP